MYTVTQCLRERRVYTALGSGGVEEAEEHAAYRQIHKECPSPT